MCNYACWLVNDAQARAKDDVRNASRHGSGGRASPAPLSGTGSVFEHALVKCRDKSQSIWLHFPNVELSFLLHAYEGAVAVYVSTLRHSQCQIFFISSIVFLVSFFVDEV